MATKHQQAFTLDSIVTLLLPNTLQDAANLLRRYREVDDFHRYVVDRKWLVIPSMLVIFLISAACVMGIVALLPDVHFVFVLPAIVLAAAVLIGSLFVQAYMFFSWIEGRSLNRLLRNRHKAAPGPIAKWLQKKLRLDMSPAPPVPWVVSAIFLLWPLAMLAYVWTAGALGVAAVAVLMPILYASFDR